MFRLSIVNEMMAEAHGQATGPRRRMFRLRGTSSLRAGLMEANMTTLHGFSVDNEATVDMELERLAREEASDREAIEDTFLDFLKSQQDDFYFISYHHPVIPRKNWLRKASHEETIRYLGQIIFPDRMEGLDLIVAPEDFRFLLIFNHDGDATLVLCQDRAH
jgi:hypothetical protein